MHTKPDCVHHLVRNERSLDGSYFLKPSCTVFDAQKHDTLAEFVAKEINELRVKNCRPVTRYSTAISRTIPETRCLLLHALIVSSVEHDSIHLVTIW